MGRRRALGLIGGGTLGAVLLAGCSPTPAAPAAPAAPAGSGTGIEVPAAAPGTPAPIRLPYGPDPDQYGVLHLPPGAGRAWPVVALVHGGNWRQGQAFSLEVDTPMAVDLTNAGIAAWNIEYRRIGGGGGFPATFTDVATAVDTLAGDGQRAAQGRLDLSRVVLLGHSAGAPLAVWAASRSRTRNRTPALVRPRGVVAQAGILDLVAAAQQEPGGGAVRALLGGTPAEQPGRYALASPTALVPADAPVVCVHGTLDDLVPIEHSRRYVAAALGAGGDARLRPLDGVDHVAVIDPADAAWAAVREEVQAFV